MKRPARLFLGVLLSTAGCLAVFAGEGETDPSKMLKVPPAEARPTGDEPEAKEAEKPAPEQSPAGSPQEASPEAGQAEPAGNSAVQPAFPLSRYQPLWERSPFQLESVAPPVESAGLAQKFALTGLAAINGEPIAFLMDRATQNRVMVKKDSESGGLSLVQVDVQQKYTDSTATVRQGSEVGVLRFDATASSPTMPPVGMVQPARMMAPGIPQPGVAPQQAPRIPGVPAAPQIPGHVASGQPVPAPPAPGVVPAVPGPGVPTNSQVQGEQGQMPPPRVIRRRALIPAAP